MPISSILPLISGVFVSFCGFFVLGKNAKSKLNQVFFFFTLAVAIWLFATFAMLSSKTDEKAIFWDRIVYIGGVFIPTTFYHFVLLFSKIKNQKKLLYLGYFLSFIFLILSRTDYFVSDLYRYSWGVHTQARFFHHIFLAFFASFIYLSLSNIYRYYKRTEGIERMQAAYILLVIFIMILNSLAFLPAYNISISPLFSYSLPTIIVLILSFAIVKYHLFEIRVLLTELLVGIIGLILFLQIIFAQNLQWRISSFSTFILFLIFAYYLVKSVHEEERKREEAEKISQAKSEFIAIVSHQLRTPLSAIKGYLSMILDGSYGELPEKVKNKIMNIYQSNERLIKLVNDILSISKIETGEMEINYKKEDLREIIKEVISELSIKAKEKNLYLTFEESKEFPKVLLDREKIRQVILNLIDNSIKYTKEGGITVKLLTKGNKLQIIISDTGEGLTEEEKEKIFERFSRGTAGTKFWTEGAGLGLYIARRFVEIHKAKIWVESEGRGKGSNFYVELPMK
jgi:signal transduction histidine kinase